MPPLDAGVPTPLLSPDLSPPDPVAGSSFLHAPTARRPIAKTRVIFCMGPDYYRSNPTRKRNCRGDTGPWPALTELDLKAIINFNSAGLFELPDLGSRRRPC